MKRMRTIKLLAVALMTAVGAQAEEKIVWLDDIDPQGNYVQDWGRPVKNKSVVGAPLRIGGTPYERGIGAHSIGRMLFDTRNASRLQGSAGPDDTNLFSTKMRFRILGDGNELWSSAVMTKGDSAVDFDVDLNGVDKVLLLVEECGDGIMYDHADWVNVRFTTDGSDVVTLPVRPTPVAKEKYVLTPAPSAAPKVNNPAVYGATPGADFLWTVMASGDRPMNFEAEGLPDGLTLDKGTGIITGVVNKAGDYKVTLTAINGTGKDSREVTIKIGDRIALTPPMGWNSWNCWRFYADDDKVRSAAEIMRDKLQPYGWTYVNIDDGWEAESRDSLGVLQGNGRFPNFKALTDYLHSMGIKFGLYSSPGPTTCGGRIASYDNEFIDAKTWAEWGVDYLKYDYCSHTEVEKDSSEGSIRAPYNLMREALDSAGRDIVYCVGYGAPRVWVWGAEAGGNQWRTTRDITDEWNVVEAIGCFQDVCAAATAPGRYNDPDMMVVGEVGGGWGTPKHPTLLTPDEQYAHVSLWSILSAPMLIGCDMESLDDFTLSLLTNSEVIAVNQDELCAPAVKRIVENGQIWYKPLADGSIALGCFNFDPYFIMWDQDDAEAMQLRDYSFSINLAELGFDGPVAVRDLWRNADEDVVTDGRLEVSVPYHGVKFIKLSHIDSEVNNN